MSAIFVSHSSKDNPHATEMRRKLREWGYLRLFLDFDPEDGIPAGRSWQTELYDKLRACRAVVVLCSPNSMGSKWCFAEVTHALARGKGVFPVKIAPCDLFPILETPQVVDMVAEPETGWERLRQGLLDLKIEARPFPWDAERDLYPGLPSFEEEDAAIYFGRETEVAELREMLRRVHDFGGQRFIVVLGASGSGKSSLLRAGVIPWLAHEKRPWLVIGPFQPGDDPWAAFREALREVAGERALRIPAVVDGSVAPEHLAREVLLVCREALADSDASNGAVLVAIDQLEELLERGDAEPAGLQSSHVLAETLRTCMETEGSPVTVVATLRSDFLPGLQNDAAWGPLPTAQYPLGPMSREALSRCIEGPASLAEIDIQPQLVVALVDDAGTYDALPLLSYTLRELWLGYAEDRDLTLQEYRVQMGGMHAAISKGAESVYAEALSKGVRPEDIRSAFLSMTRLVDEGRYDRRSQPWETFSPEVRGALTRFVSKRLLRMRDEGGRRVVEPSHATLFSSWVRAKSWVDEGGEALLWRRRLELAATDWDESGRPTDALWRGSVLTAYENHQGVRHASPDALETAFLAWSRRREGDRLRNRKLLRVAILLFVLGGAWLWQWAADRNRNRLLLEAGEVTFLSSTVDEDRWPVGMLEAVELFLSDDRVPERDVVGLGASAWILDYVSQAWPAYEIRATNIRTRLLDALRRSNPPPLLSESEWVDVPGGTFQMGRLHEHGAVPVHEVTVSPFRMLRHEVTQDQLRRFLPQAVGASPIGTAAAANLTWFEAYAFSAWMGGRLPTEAEWEYAARWRCAVLYCDASRTPRDATEVSWFRGNYPDTIPDTARVAMPVMEKEPNPLLLYDMLGNVWEWMADWYEFRYPDGPVVDPWGPVTGNARVLKGGGVFDGPADPAARYFNGPKMIGAGVGFRVVVPGTRGRL